MKAKSDTAEIAQKIVLVFPNLLYFTNCSYYECIL